MTATAPTPPDRPNLEGGDTMPRARRIDPNDLVGPGEVAERLDVKRTTVHVWRQRQLMPDPLVTVSGVPLWLWPTVRAWAAETRRLPLD